MKYIEDKDTRIEGSRYAGIVVKNKKILMIHRIYEGIEYWVFPGGHGRRGELAEETTYREIFEETSITVSNITPAFEFHDLKNQNFDYYFLCDYEDGVPTLIGEESIRNSKENFYEPVWIDFEEFTKINVLPKFAKEWVIENLINRKS